MKRKDISNAEWLVMNRVWDIKKTTAREVQEELSDRTAWSYNTVKTMLTRLAEKGWVTVKKVGGTCFYSPAVPRRSAVGNLLDDIFERVLDGSLEPLVSYLGRNRKLTEEEIKALEKIIEEQGEGKC